MSIDFVAYFFYLTREKGYRGKEIRRPRGYEGRFVKNSACQVVLKENMKRESGHLGKWSNEVAGYEDLELRGYVDKGDNEVSGVHA